MTRDLSSRNHLWGNNLGTQRLGSLAAALTFVILAVLLSSCGPTNSTLLPHLSGPRTAGGKLIINERQGTFGDLRLGMSLVAARQMLPRRNLWKNDGGQALTYCSTVAGGSCDGGVALDVVGACGVLANISIACAPPGNEAGRLAEIDLSSNDGEANRFLNPESWQAVTLRGVHLGSSIAQMKRRYAISSVGPPDEPCAFGLANPGAHYVSVVGNNTIVFGTLNGVVLTITLLKGRAPEACKF